MSVAELHGRKIAFPEAKSLADLFSEIKAPEGTAPIIATFPSWEAGTWSDRGGRSKSYVQGWLNVSEPRRSFHVQAKPEVIDWIRDNMLHGKNDRVYFEAHIWDDGRALVTAQYNQIIGSAYLAIIDAKTIPE
jgi:hypothetical protein